MEFLKPLEITPAEYSRLIAMERAAEFGVFDTTADLDDFKKSEMASKLISPIDHMPQAVEIPISCLPPTDDKYIIYKLLRQVDDLTDIVNSLSKDNEMLRLIVNQLVTANNTPNMWISQI